MCGPIDGLSTLLREILPEVCVIVSVDSMTALDDRRFGEDCPRSFHHAAATSIIRADDRTWFEV
jgi:hypothetical protein